MNLKEYQGKELFADFGIKTPGGVVIRPGEAIPTTVFKMGKKVTIKAQVAAGKRGKAKAVVFVDNKKDLIAAEVDRIFKLKINGLPVREILIYGFWEVKNYQYLAITLDRVGRCPVVVFCEEGGVDIEETVAKNPDCIKKFRIVDENQIVSSGDKLAPGSGDIVARMYKLFVSKDCTLVEINPLCELADGGYIALDAKVVIDDNALFRHPELQKYKTDDYTDLEKEAKQNNLSYVELDGDIAVIGNGAGLVMATLDTLAHFGGQVANFLDVGGGANAEQMKKALTIALKKSGVKKIFINIFGGITRADEIAKGLVEFRDEFGLKIPVVLRVVGTHEAEAKKILTAAHIDFSDDIEAAARKVVSV
jgi:succinyl-CoA synthetase beta subunit